MDNLVQDTAPVAVELAWEELTPSGSQAFAARWRSENGAAPPKRVVVADDTTNADTAYRLACEGTGLLWRGDFQNARMLLSAMARRADSKVTRKKTKAAAKPSADAAALSARDTFNLHRQAQSQRARMLGMLLLPFEPGHGLSHRRAPDVREECGAAYGESGEPYVASLRELLGLIGAHQWRKNGVQVSALGAHIYPHYGVFAPMRSEYLDLLLKAPLPAALQAQSLAFDIGTGTGVLAAILAKRGVKNVVATELDTRALACAQDNISRLKLQSRISLVAADLFAPGVERAPLIVCNPPWLPARPSSAIERAVYDPDSRMLRGFLSGLAQRLSLGGEGWLILSDLAEHLGLRSRSELEQWIAQAGLTVAGRLNAKATHGKAANADDPLHKARAAEVTSLWRLVAAQ